MARLRLTVKGSTQDHIITSDPLSEEDAKQQLSLVGETIGSVGRIRLPWAAVAGPSVLAAQIIADEPAVPPASAADGSIMGDVPNQRF